MQRNQHPKQGKRHRKPVFKFAVFTLILCAMLCCNACSATITIAGTAVDRHAVTLDLRDLGIDDAETVKDLRKLRDLATLDLRDNPLAIEAFDSIQARLPKCAIRWSVPLGAARYDSGSDTLAVSDFSQADLAALHYFPNLSSIDASGSTDYAALIQAQTEYPALSIEWTISAAGKTFSSTDTSIICAEGTTVAEVSTLLSALPKLTSIDLRNTRLFVEDVAPLQATLPAVQFLTNGLLLGGHYDTASTLLALDETTTFDLAALREQLAAFPKLTSLDLRALPVTESDVVALNTQYPSLHIRWTVPLLETLSVDSDVEELDLRGYTVSDLAAFEQKLNWLSKLTYLDMCNCGPGDSEMAALREAFPQVKVVWMLHIGYWDVRTDVKGFSMAQVGEHEGVRWTKIGDERRRYRWVTNEEIAKIRYCTDIEALDIGHSLILTDISFVKYVPTLRFLVLARTGVTDISPVRSLKNLIFFETFGCKLTDVSVLYDLPQLLYYNCSANRITDIGPLLSLKNLKRLWIINCRFTDEQLQQLKHGLPNTIIMAKGAHQTDNGWRYDNPEYLELQDLLGLVPQLDYIFPGYLKPENLIP